MNAIDMTAIWEPPTAKEVWKACYQCYREWMSDRLSNEVFNEEFYEYPRSVRRAAMWAHKAVNLD